MIKLKISDQLSYEYDNLNTLTQIVNDELGYRRFKMFGSQWELRNLLWKLAQI